MGEEEAEVGEEIDQDEEGGEKDDGVEAEVEVDEEEFPPMYESGDDMDKATTYKMEASDLKSAGDYQSALEKYNLAITTAPPSALLLANRGDVLYRLAQYKAAVRDCDAALEKNPDRCVVCSSWSSPFIVQSSQICFMCASSLIAKL